MLTEPAEPRRPSATVGLADVDAMSRLGRAIADPTRCRILLAMAGGPAYPAQLADTLGLTRPNVSNHLTFLRGSGLVAATPEGRQVRYDLASPHLAHALWEFLAVVTEDAEGAEGAGGTACVDPDVRAEVVVRDDADVRDRAGEQPAVSSRPSRSVRSARPHETLPASGHEPARPQESGPARAHRPTGRTGRRSPRGEGAS